MSQSRGVLVAACLMMGLAGCDRLPGRPTLAERPTLPSQVTDFDALYGRHCAGCHGTEGRLGAARPLNDALYLALVSEASLEQVITHGVSGTAMSAFAQRAGGTLTDHQVEILAQGLRARWGNPDRFSGVALPPYNTEAATAAGSGSGDPERGVAVYATYCARCHGPNGTGGPHGGSIVDPSYLALVSNQGLRTAVIAGRPDLDAPDWRANVPGRPMTPQEITDVVAWLVAQRH